MAQLALITGAAGGIGQCLALELAGQGYDILAVDVDGDGLAALKAQIASSTNKVTCQAHVMDLARLESAQELYDFCKSSGHTVEILVNNVGFGKMGEHIEQDPATVRNMVVLNNILLMETCLLFGRDMKERGDGKILNVASLVGFSASPYFAAYSATKASTLTFSTAFGQEMSEHGVAVSCLCPGTTETKFLDTASLDSEASRGMRRFASVWVAKPDLVAKEGVKGLMKGKLVIVPTLFLRLQAAVLGALPASFVSGFVKRKIRKANAKEKVS